MESKGMKWYEGCMNSLFEGQKNNWVYRKVRELTDDTRKNNECMEEIITDTKLRYRALLDYTTDVFTCDRMENKSYQIPFAMYFVAKSMFRESVAAIASEALMTIANWDYRVRSNLLRFILFDDDPEKYFIEKMTIFFMSLEECQSLEDVYMADCKDISFAEYYLELIRELECIDYERTEEVLQRIRNSEKRYCLIYDTVLWKANESEVPENLKSLYQKCEKSKSNYSHAGFEDDLVMFIVQDMEDYFRKGNAASYNPFWIFGSRKYKENIEFIFRRKHIVEFDTVWIQYLYLKAEDKGENVEYISSFHSLLPENGGA